MNFLKKYWVMMLMILIGIILYFVTDNDDRNRGVRVFSLVVYVSVMLTLEQVRGNEGLVRYYLINIPFSIFLLFTGFLWYLVPVIYYFSNTSSLYYTFCLEILGGVLGEGIWVVLYLLVWGYLGWKLYSKIEIFINSVINKFKK